MDRPIALIGPMGVGKTTVGKKLAKTLAVSFLDTDKEFEKIHGSITKFFQSQGESAFRKVESDILIDCLNSAGVVATGGGIVLREENRENLKRAFVVYLSTSGKHVGARILSGKRPLLRNGFSDWRRIYNERKPLYESLADLKIDTSGMTLKAIVGAIIEGRND